LYELIEIIWRGKWLISAFVAISVMSGFVYLQLAQPKFQVSVPFEINLYSVSAQQICGKNIKCIVNETNKLFIKNLDSNWNLIKKDNIFALSTESPLNVKTYDDVFDKLNQTTTNQIYNEALDEVTLIKTILNENLVNTERIANNLLNATRLVKAIDSGEKMVSFGSSALKKTSLKVPLILVLSIILGGIIGVVFVIVNNTIRKRK